ncbi:MAG: hypothetical protein H6713_07545 [Myxococcales bacterium]|nr:hypothetical protein [Myxococcales bacterium]MCB9749845.1 hypothetical protein [Myxococcales bacterium]
MTTRRANWSSSGSSLAIVERELEVGASRFAVTRDHDEALRCAATGRVALAGAPGPRAPAP